MISNKATIFLYIYFVYFLYYITLFLTFFLIIFYELFSYIISVPSFLSTFFGFNDSHYMEITNLFFGLLLAIVRVSARLLKVLLLTIRSYLIPTHFFTYVYTFNSIRIPVLHISNTGTDGIGKAVIANNL